MTNRNFFVELQSLRGLAAVTVLLGHGMNMYQQPEAVYSAALVFNGRGAVVMFFVLSGFVLTRSLAGSNLDAISWTKFLIGRAARIYPAIWVVSTASVAYMLTLHRWVAVPDASVAYLSHYRADRFNPLYISASFLGLAPFLIPQLWTITIELAASILMPLSAWLAFSRPKLFVVFSALALLVSFTVGPMMPFAIGIFGPSFLAGTWLARRVVMMQQHVEVRSENVLGTALVIVAGGLFPFTQFLPLSYSSPLAALVETALAYAIIGPIVLGSANLPILRSRILVSLGDISYSVYLLHYMLLSVLLDLFQVTGLLHNLGVTGLGKPIVLDIGTFLLTVALSSVLYRYVELPGVRVGKRIMARFSGFVHTSAEPNSVSRYRALTTRQSSGQ